MTHYIKIKYDKTFKIKELITSLIDFEDKADDLIDAHFRNNQDNETNDNIDELFNELRDLIDDWNVQSWIFW